MWQVKPTRCRSCKQRSDTPNATGKVDPAARRRIAVATGSDRPQRTLPHLIRSGLAGVIHAENYDQRDPAAYRTLPAMTHLSYRSKLLELAASGRHHGVKVDETSRLQLIGWIDANGPYRGTDEVRGLDDRRCRAPPQVARP
jgi:hypothetical protein